MQSTFALLISLSRFLVEPTTTTTQTCLSLSLWQTVQMLTLSGLAGEQISACYICHVLDDVMHSCMHVGTITAACMFLHAACLQQAYGYMCNPGCLHSRACKLRVPGSL